MELRRLTTLCAFLACAANFGISSTIQSDQKTTTTPRTTDTILTTLPSTGWTAWASWNKCSRNCGGCGKQNRTRTCLSNPTFCPGKSIQLKRCNFQFCLVSEKQCTKLIVVPCGPRGRRCTKWITEPCQNKCCAPLTPGETQCIVGSTTRPPPTEPTTPKSTTTTTMMMTTTTTPKPTGWTTWSSWSKCSHDCGACGKQSRKRSCLSSDGSCPGKRVQYKRCNFNLCTASGEKQCTKLTVVPCGTHGRLCTKRITIPCKGQSPQCCPPYKPGYTRCVVGGSTTPLTSRPTEPTTTSTMMMTTTTSRPTMSTTSRPTGWATWSSWSRCTHDCGGCGTRFQSRTCLGGNCPGSRKIVERCNLSFCQKRKCFKLTVVPCGSRGRWCTKRITVPCKDEVKKCCAPYMAGKTECVKGIPTTTTPKPRATTTHPVKPTLKPKSNSGWKPWSSWTACLVSDCGGCGKRYRSRRCSQELCSGPSVERQQCNFTPCSHCEFQPTNCPCCAGMLVVNGQCKANSSRDILFKEFSIDDIQILRSADILKPDQ